MELITVLLAVAILAFSALIRSMDILKFKSFGVDTFGILDYCRWLKSRTSNVYRVGKNPAYPNFLPRLINSLHLPLRVSHLIPKFFDLLTSIELFLFTNWLTGNESIALLAIAIYTVTPINIVSCYGMGTRSIGSFFFSSALIASYVAMVELDHLLGMMFLIVAILSVLLLMNSNRIAYKSYFIMVPFLLSPTAYLAALIGISLCMVVSRKEFLDDLKGQIFLIKYFRNSRLKEKSVKKRVALIFYYSLWWCTGLFAVAKGADYFLSIWLCATVALSFIWAWGEGERHIALSSIPASILSASIMYQQPLFAPIILVEIAIVTRTTINLLKGKYLVSVDKELSTVFSTMKKTLNEKSLVLCLPPAYSAAVAYHTDKKVLDGVGTTEEGILFQEEVQQRIKTEEELENLASQYEATHVFVDRKMSQSFLGVKWKSEIKSGRFEVLERTVPYENKPFSS